jgi:ATP-dependent exoDNAse (exonuclease V) alpha subunit
MLDEVLHTQISQEIKDEVQIQLELDKMLDAIKKCISDKNDWIERNEICETLHLPKNTRLVDGRLNSKMGQLLYYYIRKMGFEYKKVELDEEDKFNYEIWVCASGVSDNEKFENMLDKRHKNVFRIIEKALPKSKKSSAAKLEKVAKTEELEEEDGDNEYLNQITDLIKKGENLFITGYAGTGKSYILNKLKKKFKIDVTSTTGLAAVNIQGQTIHSWAGVGICNKPVEQVIENIFKRSALKKQIFNCKILAIDEISMLDAKTFDYIDTVLRQLKDESKPFGGIQVLLFGDFFQLPPVDKSNGFCFESDCWRELNLKTIFLEKIYRQNDEDFIKSLNNMRLNQLTDADLKLFYNREVDYNTNDSEVLHIFSTNREADSYNTKKFNSVESKVHRFKAVDKIHRKKSEIEVDKNNLNEKLSKFDLMTWETFDKSCKAPCDLELKKNCKVMLLKNLDFKKGLINGSCGTVLELDETKVSDSILIKFDNGIEEVIAKHTFEAYRDGELLVSREQYPLRLAYGITIHKSQGMTLEKLVVDCSRIFECGQAYVALSRIKTVEGLYLKSFNPNKVSVSEQVVNFYQSIGTHK